MSRFMRFAVRSLAVLSVAGLGVLLSACGPAGLAPRGANDAAYEPRLPPANFDQANAEAYNAVVENPFRSVSVAALSTFSADVNTASYSNVRRHLNDGTLPPRDAVFLADMLNYFP